MTIIGSGKEAVTNFKVLERFNHHTFLECKLETGRTHQIRVHLNYIGNPIISDPMYGTRKLFDDNGQYLHAFELSFIHPRTNERVSFNAPIPAYFEEFLKVLRGNPQ